MSAMTTHGVFSVQFIRNGDVVTCFTEVLKQNGDGTNLVQFWDDSNRSVTPDTDWSSTYEANQPIIYIRLRSSNNYPVVLNNVTWAYKGSTLVFPPLTTSWQSNTDTTYAGKFKSRLDNNGYPCLRIANNLISATSLGNTQITYTVSYKSLGSESTVSGSLDVWLRLASSKAVQLFLSANRRELTIANPTAQVTAVAYNGGSTVDFDNYVLRWYDADGVIESGGTSVGTSTITVTRDMVQGREMIECRMFNDATSAATGTNWIASSAIDIWDVDDEYQIGRSPVAGKNYCSDGCDAEYIVHVLRNGSAFTPTSGSIQYSYKIFNCAGMVTKAQTAFSTNDHITVTKADCLVQFKDINGTLVPDENTYGDANVEVTAQWDI